MPVGLSAKYAFILASPDSYISPSYPASISFANSIKNFQVKSFYHGFLLTTNNSIAFLDYLSVTQRLSPPLIRARKPLDGPQYLMIHQKYFHQAGRGLHRYRRYPRWTTMTISSRSDRLSHVAHCGHCTAIPSVAGEVETGFSRHVKEFHAVNLSRHYFCFLRDAKIAVQCSAAAHRRHIGKTRT